MAAAAVPLIPASKRPLTVISESVATDNNANFKKLIENEMNTTPSTTASSNTNAANSKELKVNVSKRHFRIN